MHVFTGNAKGAETSSEVSVVITGTKGSTGQHKLKVKDDQVSTKIHILKYHCHSFRKQKIILFVALAMILFYSVFFLANHKCITTRSY